MKIQRFANVYDKIITDYKNYAKTTKTDMSNLATEKQNLLDAYNKNYEDQLNQYNDLMNQERDYIDTYGKEQARIQQQQTDYNIGLINQNKEEAQKQMNQELGEAYIDYQKGINQFGGSQEQLAAQGLSGTGYAKNQDIAMNLAYQNRIASAKSALQKANTDYDNQIQQALLTNDANLAKIALDTMQQNYQLALKGFEYTTNMQNNLLQYQQSLNDSYFSKQNTLQSRLDSYYSTISNAKVAKAEAKAAEKAAKAYAKSSGGGSSGNWVTGLTENNKKKDNQKQTNSITIDDNTISNYQNVIDYVNACLSYYQRGAYNLSSMQSKAKSALDAAKKAGIISASQYNTIYNSSILFRTLSAKTSTASSGSTYTSGGGRKG